jgi:micrococcal nuclease
MKNKKGSSWWSLIWIILIIVIVTNAVRHSYYRQTMYDDLTGKIIDNQNEELQRQQEDYYQQQLEEERQRQYEEELRRQQEQEYQRQVQQQQEDYYQQQYDKQDTIPQTPIVKCTDSDNGKDYYTKGYITHGDGTKEYDECSTGAYEDYVWEHYCTTSGTGTLNYKCLYGCSDGACNTEPEITAVIVSYVSDGDTFKLSTGETIRLIGLNTPEIGQKCSSEATNKLKELVLGKEITLKQDVDNKDQYGRLLRYIYVGNTFINLEMVKLGFAHKYEYGSNTKYSSQFEQAENEAKQNEGCLWLSEEINYIQNQCIYITNFHFNAAGDDNYNLNDEYVTLGNRCSYSIDMASWTIKDETASHLYTIPSFTFQAGSTFTLFTGTGTNTNSALYLGRTSGNYAAIWNNNGDTLFLRDSSGNLVLSQSYSGY